MSYLLGQHSDCSGTVSSCDVTFNSDISNWVVSGATNMEGMLYYASLFN